MKAQELVQLLSSFVFPSSHCSVTSFTPLPHMGITHVFLQESVSTIFPSSHCSPASTTPFEQIGCVTPEQTVLHLFGWPFNEASSHCSVPSLTPLPQTGGGLKYS